MNDHDLFRSIMSQKELAQKAASPSGELDELMKQAESPKALAMLMFRLLQERERTNKLLENINEKYDRIMFSLKTTPQTPVENNTQQNRFEVLPEQDQLILKSIEERGGCTANDIKTMLNYKGLNAACQRMNKLFKEGYLRKVSSGKKVVYLAKS